MAKKTPEQKAAELYAKALANYNTWGHWVYETESVESLAAEFASSGESVTSAIKMAKIFSAYAKDIQGA